MAEDKAYASTRSPRYSSSRSLGFTGGSIGPGGNLQQPTFSEVSGINPPPPPQEPPPAIQDFRMPRRPSTAAQVGTAAGSALVGEGVKSAGRAAGEALFPKRDAGLSGFGGTATFPRFGGGQQIFSGEELIGESIPLADIGQPVVTELAAESVLEGVGEGALEGAGEGAFEGAAEGLLEGGVEGSFPVVGPAINLAQGDVEGLVGTTIGGAVGSIFGPVGTVVGSAIGGALSGDCFITEAVAAAGGQGDNAEELQVLRWFRDNIMMANPQGQAMVQEYRQIAPIVVEAIAYRPDALQIFQAIKSQFIDQAVEAVKSGNFKAALEIYAQMINFVQPLAAESIANEHAGGPMERFGQQAAMVGQDDQVSGAMAPSGPGDADFTSMGEHANPMGNSVPMAQDLPIGQFRAPAAGRRYY